MADGADALHDIRTTDYHAAGEPFRIVDAGTPDIPGPTVLARREAAWAESVDVVRRMLCHEPRGHADMYGCFLVPPDDSGADLGVLFWHKDGYSTACGHGTIALGAWAVESGRVTAVADGDTAVVIDVPSGRVTARVHCAGGRVQSVAFRNVASYVVARRVPVTGSFGSARIEVAYGGALYAAVPAEALGLSVRDTMLPRLIHAGREIKRCVDGTEASQHPTDSRLSGIYGVVIYEELPDLAEGPHQRNVTVFADGQVDRSPCGSGTSARLALLAEDGLVGVERVLTHESIVDTRFTGRIVDGASADPRRGIVTEVEGRAFRTGEHRFFLDRRDPLGSGFVLR